MKKFKAGVVGIILLLLVAIMNIGQTIYNDNQASYALVLGLSLEGEYKIGENDWRPIVKGEHISASEGDVILRGKLMMSFPDGEVIGPLAAGEYAALHFDHLSGSIWINGIETQVFDSENLQLGNSTCGKSWFVYQYSVDEEDTFEIHLQNPHVFGNELAVDDFLNSMRIYTGNDFELMIPKQMEHLRIIGYIVIFVSMLIFGIAMFSGMLRLPQSRDMWIVGVTILFAGCFFVVKSTETYTLNTNLALNTALYLLSILMYVPFLQILIVEIFEKPLKKAGNMLAALSGVITGSLIIYATVFNIKLYDVLPVWAICQIVISSILLIICGRNLRYLNVQMKGIQIVLGTALICLIIDIVATRIGLWQGPHCSSVIFLIMLLAVLFIVLRVFPKSIQAWLYEKDMQAELEKSKTAVMLSQIQPHFLYNALGTIRELCRQDPEDARNALGTFITYLRGNMDSIQREYTIHFSKELKHISAYLELEKLRFGEDLQVVYDIQEEDFYIPSLTIQPLIENAVKHGIFGREDGGTVTLHTHREEDKVIVRIQDDGVGFDVNELEKLAHVGIHNVRTRLSHIVNASLEIESKKNLGTTATITIYDRKD